MTPGKISSLMVFVIMTAAFTVCDSAMSAKASGKGPDETGGVSMRVLWTVSGYVFGKGPAWGEQEAKALLFKPLDITGSEIIFGGRICKGVTFRQETVNTAEYLAAWQVAPQTLGIADQKLEVVKTNCDIPGFQEYIRLSDMRLVVPINGVFFFFEPAVTR